MWPFSRKRAAQPEPRKVFVSDGEGWRETVLHEDASGRKWVSSRNGWLELGDGGLVLEASALGGLSAFGPRRWREDPQIARTVKGS